MAEEQKKIWFKRTPTGNWPAHWKGWVLCLSVFPVWLAWTLFCAVTSLALHPYIAEVPIVAYIVWLLIYMDRNAAKE